MRRVVHFEFNSSDAASSVQFFSDVFGWNVDRWGDEDYWLLRTGDGPGIDGAVMPSRDGQPRTVTTIEVESVDEAARRVAEAGGAIVVEKMAVRGVGWLIYCTDPGGVLFGCMEDDESAA